MCQLSDIAVIYLVHPKCRSDDYEKDGELNDDGEDEDTAISSAHSQRCTNPLESLPSKRLEEMPKDNDQILFLGVFIMMDSLS